MLDYKDIITKHCALGMTGSAIAETLGVSKSGVNDFLRAFKACKVEMSRNVQSGNTQNLKSSAAPVRLPAAPAPTPGTSRVAVPAGCVYRP